MSQPRRAPGAPLKKSQRRGKLQAKDKAPVTRYWNFGDTVKYREQTGTFYRIDNSERTIAYIVIGERTYRVELAELR